MPASNAPWPAPAKLNRFLHIVGRRSDGYHLLQTIFQFLDYGDELTFELRSDGLIERQGVLPGIPVDADLSIRAARLLQKTCNVAAGATISIEKRLPLGGGLGGGSSDAATVLVALNHYWKTGLTPEQLANLGLQLGADVPVFVHGQAAWAEGIGDKLTPLRLDEAWFLVLIPPCQVETRAIFNNPKLTRDSEPIKIEDFIAGRASNDCAAIVYQHYPAIAAAAAWLSEHAEAHLTGTGACLFAVFPERDEAQRVLDRLPADLAGFLACGMNCSPLQSRLQREITDSKSL